MRTLLSLLILAVLTGCDGKSGSTSDTGHADSTCEPDYDEVECCNDELGEVSTCCCYQEECEEVMDFTINDDGSCTQNVHSG
jgi:hypothetical protein